MFVTSRSDW